MNFKPSPQLTEQQVQNGLKQVIKDGLTAEAMVCLTGGTFLMAMAVLMKASNFQIGLLSSLPIFTNIFQLFSIWLVQRYNNRRAVMVISSFIARLPLFAIGALPFLFSNGTSITVLIFMLSFHYLFGSIAGASWSSWMKDLVPGHMMGSYFGHRRRMMLTLNTVLSVFLALSLDYIKANYPQYELTAYAVMFIVGGISGMLGVYALARTPEPQSYLPKENLLKLFGKPLQNKNFRKLLVFQSAWTFALSMSTPFFSVYMMKTIGLSLSYIIGLSLISQVSTIFSIKMWGKYADRFSNKTIISIAAPIYVGCMLGYLFISPASGHVIAVSLLVLIHIFGGFSLAGITLALDNFGMKLAPSEEAIVYISTRNIIVALIAALAPILGGLLADVLATQSMALNLPLGFTTLHLLQLQGWSFLFLAGGVLAFASLRLLGRVAEAGETKKSVAVGYMRVAFKMQVQEKWNPEALRSLIYYPVVYPVMLGKKVQERIVRRVAVIRRMQAIAEVKKRA